MNRCKFQKLSSSIKVPLKTFAASVKVNINKGTLYKLLTITSLSVIICAMGASVKYAQTQDKKLVQNIDELTSLTNQLVELDPKNREMYLDSLNLLRIDASNDVIKHEIYIRQRIKQLLQNDHI